MIHRNVRGGVPSPYPRFLFHGLRTAQLLASIVVSGIMAYFIYYLRMEHFAIPWTFIVLIAVSLATILALLITIIFYNFTYLSPGFNLLLNGSISLFWALGLALLSWSVSTSHVLAKACTGSVWGGEAEAGVCRDYKALWGMALVGTVSTFAALTLDIATQRKVTRRGVYKLPEDDKDAQKLSELKSMRVRTQGYEAPREQGGDGVWRDEHLHGEEYHSRYGAEEEVSHGLRGDVVGGYSGVGFRD
ncbi:uncharacterized protein LY89DRAFT_696449 [Mollisia scopiformis]|uniref:MARVEL domain-containing protein n=1 Tax=Mollisia scopiformis TaxID=149040 RepID=A0A194XCV3_MOLSC|nr:uncharacterized protein LY89DRAFT_696449 [Mollisia scopiformis]KUJ17989.1 hypothetical protein LY89DRAFT_696449 [Mollisia scopiformis]